MSSLLDSFQSEINVAVIGASGGIGTAFCHHLVSEQRVGRIYAFSRSPLALTHEKIKPKQIDITDTDSIQQAAAAIGSEKLSLVLVTTGILHHETALQPEKSLRDLSLEKLQNVFAINTFGPAMVAKYFLPLLDHQAKSVFAVLSARVGSISDNRLGGWHAYRASKAALNMLVKNFSLELRLRHKQQIVVGLHPGTVNTPLSEPFQARVPAEKLFTPEDASKKLLAVIDQLTPASSGSIFAWDGSTIAP